MAISEANHPFSHVAAADHRIHRSEGLSESKYLDYVWLVVTRRRKLNRVKAHDVDGAHPGVGAAGHAMKPKLVEEPALALAQIETDLDALLRDGKLIRREFGNSNLCRASEGN
ncbi:hypothetical protein ACFSQT_23015 [Mesorhizobium calcicola]|uniref:Uncharacterized protein n=1 Tax=Mesorhizobium calcicola TaxID=1300310 RepID=A0ABW4WID9_9HYPH